MSKTISEFLESFPIHLHHREPESKSKQWVFWSQYEGSQNSSSLADSSTRMLHEMIKSAFCNTFIGIELISQFWAPVRIEGRWLLSTYGQPFGVRDLSDHFLKYRLDSQKYLYTIDENNPGTERDPMIISGGPAIAFLNRIPYMDECGRIQLEPHGSSYRHSTTLLFPICSPSRRCIGVVECTMTEQRPYSFRYLLFSMLSTLKDAGLDVLNVQELIPYQTRNSLKPARDEIGKALEIVCQSHNLTTAQVWIAYEGKSKVPFLSTLDDTQPTKMLALRLTGYHNTAYWDSLSIEDYYRVCGIFPLKNEELAFKTLKDYQSRYVSMLSLGKLIYDRPVGFGFEDTESSALAICLRGNDTGNFDYAFEFVWLERSGNAVLLEAILLTLKRCLPSYKFAFGAELGDELDVIDVDSSTDFETKHIKIFQAKKQVVNHEVIMDNITPTITKCKTTPILLPQEVIEKQFGKTMKEAAKNLNVSESILKRKLKDLGIREWPGPKLMKGKPNDLCIIEIDTNEKDNGGVQEPPAININKHTLIIKVEHADDMIKFHLPVSRATFVTVENEIGIKFKLTLGSYKLKYLDEDGDWISLTSDEEMSDCIKSSGHAIPIVVRLRVLVSTQPISGPDGSSRMCSSY